MKHFFTGLHQPSDAKNFDFSFISVNRLKMRKSDMKVNNWIMDSGAFTILEKYGGYPNPVSEYAEHIRRWAGVGNLLAAVAQDYMCEPFMLTKTGLTVEDHQRLTIERYDDLLKEDTSGIYILPVLQGYTPKEYIRHIEMYGERLKQGMWVGVGSVCKRNGNVAAIEEVLGEIFINRPDLLLHGFGLKSTAFKSALVCNLLHTADSMAWSFSARKQGRNGNDWKEAEAWTVKVNARVASHNG